MPDFMSCVLVTMTVYQQGVPMEGWNDCPAVLSRPSNKRKVSRSRRVGMDRSPSAELTLQTSRDGTPEITSEAISPEPAIPVLLGPRSGASAMVGAGRPRKSEPVDTDALEALYELSTFQAKDVENCRKRIMTLLEHGVFVNDVVRLSKSEPFSVINDLIRQYTTANDNVGPGCLALRKLIESQPDA